MLIETLNGKPVESRLCPFCSARGRYIKPIEDRAGNPAHKINMPSHWPCPGEVMVCAVCKFTGRVKVAFVEPKYGRN